MVPRDAEVVVEAGAEGAVVVADRQKLCKYRNPDYDFKSSLNN
jgi:hypothetical protein